MAALGACSKVCTDRIAIFDGGVAFRARGKESLVAKMLSSTEGEKTAKKTDAADVRPPNAELGGQADGKTL